MDVASQLIRPDVDVQLRLVPVTPSVVRDKMGDVRALSPQERRTAESLRCQDDVASYVVAHVTLRRMLADRLGQVAAAPAFARTACPTCKGPSGRPRTEPFQGVHFSLSRTRGMVAVALSSRPVGIDVDRVRSGVDQLLIQGLHPDEEVALRKLPGSRGEAFTRCWVRKEAVLKAAGTGIAHGMREPYVGVDPRPAQPLGWQLRDLAAAAGYVAAVAVATATRAA